MVIHNNRLYSNTYIILKYNTNKIICIVVWKLKLLNKFVKCPFMHFMYLCVHLCVQNKLQKSEINMPHGAH